MAIDEGWIRTVESGITDARWDEYDTPLQAESAAYSTRFAGSPGFSAPSWLLFKAMLWTESGGPDNAAWKGRVMQIGNRGDPAYGVLRRAAEGSDLIMSADLRTLLKRDDNIQKPEVNISAALAYLFTRMAIYDTRSVDDPGLAKPKTYTVRAGDSLYKIAIRLKTTLDSLRANNKAVRPNALQVGAVLAYVPASMKTLIVGWRDFQTAIIAERYNGGGDPEYSAKLNHLLVNVFPKIKR